MGTCTARMATIATTTDQSADVFALLRELTHQQLTWSFEGTTQAESVVQRVGAASVRSAMR